MSTPPYVNEKYTTRQSSYTDNTQFRSDNKYSRYRQQSNSGYSAPSIHTDDGATTPSFSENARTPTRGLSRMSSCRVSMSDFSETSSTRAATPPPVNSLNVSLNREICSQSTTCGQLINLAVSKGHVFNAVNWATCLHRLAKLFPTEAKNHRSMVVRFLGQANQVLLSANEGSKFQPQHLATLLWAMAKLSIVDPAFVNDLVGKAMDVSDSLKAQDMANIAWSLAKMGVQHEEMFGMICDRIASGAIIGQFKPMEIASTTWAFGTVGRTGMGISEIGPVIEALAGECLSRDLRDFSPQALANVLWALSKLQYNCSSLFAAFGSHIVSQNRLREFKPQEIANVVWAMTNLKIVHETLFRELVSYRVVNWTVFDSHALATVFGGVMDFVTLDLALIVANRVLKKNTTLSVSHCGLFLAGLSGFLSVNATIGAACSVLTERLLGEDLVSLDLHAVRGLIQTLPDSVPIIDLLGNAQLVEAEYGSANQSECGRLILSKLDPKSKLAQNVTALLISLATNVADGNTVGEKILMLMEKPLPQLDEIIPILSKLDKDTCLQVLPKFLKHVNACSITELAILVSVCNEMDTCVDLINACVVKIISSGTSRGDTDSLAKIVYSCSEFVSRHPESSLSVPAKTLTRLLAQVVIETQWCGQMSLLALAHLITASGTECKQIVAASQSTLLGQCCQSGPGGLALLRETLGNFSLYCKLVACFLQCGHLPSNWVTADPPLGAAELADPASLAGALSLSVALGNMGADETQREIIGSWVLPLMGGSFASPQLTSRTDRVFSDMTLLTQCMPPGFFD